MRFSNLTNKKFFSIGNNNLVAHIASKYVFSAFSQNNIVWRSRCLSKLSWCAETDFRADVECFDALLDRLDDLLDLLFGD